jgi:CheY-like chemotaxis protein
MAAQAPERDHRASAAPSRARVLVVDDEPAMLRALRINLRVRKYDVTTAATGQEALTEAGRRPPDAVILDLGLPDVDGIEVIKRLRGWSRAPVIVLSGRAGPGDKIAALDAGADDYVTKPFSMEELLARLRAALRRDDTGPPPVRVRVGRREIAPAAAPAVTTAASDEPNGGVLIALPGRAHGSRQGLAGRPLVAWKPSPYRAHWYEQVNIVLAGRR